jgi:hypothetical protein
LNERIRALLEEAVADAQPRELNPLPAVLRQARASRRRTRTHAAVGVGFAVLALLGVAVVAQAPPSPDGLDVAAVRPGAPVTAPAVPVVEDGKVRAGGTTIPIPDGWRLLKSDPPRCMIAPRTLYVGSQIRAFDSPCRRAAETGLSSFGVRPYSEQDLTMAQRADAYEQITLPGGQPGWVSGATLDASSKEPKTVQRVQLFLPWSGAKINFITSRDELKQILATIRTEPVTPAKLMLPASASAARWSVAVGKTEIIDDPVQFRRLRVLLAGLTDVVPNEAACGPNVPIRRIELVDEQNKIQETIAIGYSPDCAQATSSLGGRVRIPAGVLQELTELFAESKTP